MDFLRRLHPRHAEAPGAVRPDLAAWRAAGLPRAVPEGDERPAAPRSVVDAGEGRTSVPARAAAAPDRFDPDDRLPPAKAAMPAVAPVPAPVASAGPPQVPAGHGSSAVQAAGIAAAPPPSSSAPTRTGAARVMPTSLQPPAPAAPAATARSVARAGDASPASPPPTRTAALPSLPAAAPPPSPLRAGVQPLQRPADAVVPTLVQVTIDRIDVRLPPAQAAAAPPRRTRPAPTVALADYLREREGSRR